MNEKTPNMGIADSSGTPSNANDAQESNDSSQEQLAMESAEAENKADQGTETEEVTKESAAESVEPDESDSPTSGDEDADGETDSESETEKDSTSKSDAKSSITRQPAEPELPGDDGYTIDFPSVTAADLKTKTVLVACPRCENPVPRGSSFCLKCGAPMTARPRPVSTEPASAPAFTLDASRMRIIAGLALAAAFVLLIIILSGGSSTSGSGYSRSIGSVVTANKALAKDLTNLRPGSSAGDAINSSENLRSAIDEATITIPGLDLPEAEEKIAVSALTAERAFVKDVKDLLTGTPTEKLMKQVVSNAQAADEAMGKLNNINVSGIGGTTQLIAYLRAGGSDARVALSPALPSGSATTTTKSKTATGPLPPFITAIQAALTSQTRTHEQAQSLFDYMRAARDGIETLKSGAVNQPKSAQEAMAAATKLVPTVQLSRSDAADRVRSISARQDNQKAIVEKLAATLDASAATLRELDSCLQEGGEPVALARKCLQQIKDLSEKERVLRNSFAQSYNPALRSVKLPDWDRKL